MRRASHRMTREEFRAIVHQAIDEQHSIDNVLNEVALAINEHAEEHVRTDLTGRGPNNIRAIRLDQLAEAVVRLCARARSIGMGPR